MYEKWRTNFYKNWPYPISGDCLMGNSDEVQTPKRFSMADVGLILSYYIGNYKGERNESFMYGSEDKTCWFDYDLVSAYTTAKAHLSLASYYKGHLINPADLDDGSTEDFLRSYLLVNGTCQFPETVKYPSIPCYVDSSITSLSPN